MALLLLVAKSRRAANNISTFVSSFVNLPRNRNAPQIDRHHISRQKVSRRTRN
jgi:hypothetical protein